MSSELPVSPRRLVRLAQVAYFFSCLGAASLVVRAIGYLPIRPHTTLSPVALAVWWVVAFASPLGVLLGLIALALVRRAGRSRRRTHAAAAVVTGILVSLLLVLLTPVIDDSCQNAYYGSTARRASCQFNLRQIAMATQMYAQDCDDRFPPLRAWNEELFPYLKNEQVLRCPAETQDMPSYAMNHRLAGVHTPDVDHPDHVAATFDAVPARNLVGGPGLLPRPPRHNDSHNVAFLDGRVRFEALGSIPNLTWRPSLNPPKSKPTAARPNRQAASP